MHPCLVFAILAALLGYKVLAYEVPFAGRPLFFIREKKRRVAPSVEPGELGRAPF